MPLEAANQWEGKEPTSARRRDTTAHQVRLRPLGTRRRPVARTGLLAKGNEGEGAGEGRPAEDGWSDSSFIRRSLGQAQGAYREKALAGVPWAGKQGCKAQGPHFPGFPLVVRCEHCRGPERLVLSWTHREPTTSTGYPEVQANAVSNVGLLNWLLAPPGGTMVYHQRSWGGARLEVVW